MLNALIEFSLKNRFVVLLLAGHPDRPRDPGRPAACRSTPSPTRRRSRCRSTPSPRRSRRRRSSGRSPFPSSRPSAGSRGCEEVRSVSKFGLSQVVAIFDDDIDIYFARQQINERLGEAELPAGDRAADDGAGRHRPGRGLPLPPHQRHDYDLTELRTLAGLGRPAAPAARAGRGRDQRLGRPGQAVRGAGRPGQAGQVRAHARRRDPGPATRTTRTSAAATSSRAGEVEPGPGGRPGPLGRTRSPSIVITASDGVPIRVRDVAEVAIGHVIRRGGVTADGKGEVVLGLAFMRMGENSPRRHDGACDKAMEDVKKALPPGVEVDGRLRAHRPGRPGARTPSSGTCSKGRSWSSPSCSPSSATSGPG